MPKDYRVVNTISTSNAEVSILRNNENVHLDMNVRLTASVVKNKSQYFCLGRMFSTDITTGLTGSGTLSVYEMYAVFGNDLKELLQTGHDSSITIKATVESDGLEYNLRTVIMTGVVFDQETLFNIDELNDPLIKDVPFTFSGLEFESDFDEAGEIPQYYRVQVIRGTGGGSYLAGETVTVVADTPELGYTFLRWEVSEGVDIVDVSLSTVTFIMPAFDVFLVATYERVAGTSFSDAPWDFIDQVCKAGLASSYWSIGDERVIEMTDGSSFTVAIFGFDHDELADGTGKSGITVGSVNLTLSTYRSSQSSTTAGGWWTLTFGQKLQNDIISVLPASLSNVIKTVKKTAVRAGTGIVDNLDVQIFSPAAVEITGAESIPSEEFGVSEGEQYRYWIDIRDGSINSGRTMRREAGTAAVNWITRSGRNLTYMLTYSTNGAVSNTASASTVWMFCI